MIRVKRFPRFGSVSVRSFGFFLFFVANSGAQCPTWQNNTEYSVGTVVSYNGSSWRALNPSNLNTVPGTETWFWAVSTDLCGASSASSSSTGGSSSSSSPSLSSSSTVEDNYWIGLPDDDPFTAEKLVEWEDEPVASARCLLGASWTNWVDSTDQSDHELKKCFHPDSLQGRTLTVPANVTRIAPDGITLCRIVERAPDSTVIVYVYDHSGSMGSNDPSPAIADDAFRDGLQRQYLLDSSSHAGYIPFASTVLTEKKQPARLDAATLATLGSAINETYIGGTNFEAALAQADSWLNQSVYNNYRKAIIFLADGDPNEQSNSVSLVFGDSSYAGTKGYLINLVQQAGHAPVFGIFLGNSASGQVFMKHFSEASGAYSTHISQAYELGPVIESILREIISETVPTELSMGNYDLQVRASATISDPAQVKIQADSSRTMLLDRSIPLRGGLNEMVLSTVYTSTTGNKVRTDEQEIRFYIDVSDSYSSGVSEVVGSAFTTRCEEWNSLEMSDSATGQNPVYFHPDIERGRVRFSTRLSSTLGDTTRVELWSSSLHDRESILLKRRTGSDSNAYEGVIPIDWLVKNNFDGKLAANWLDTFYLSWVHPDDPRDYARYKALAWAPPPVPDTVVYLDTDADGRLDQIVFLFAGPLVQEAFEGFNWKLRWRNDLDDSTSLSRAEAPNFVDLLDSFTVQWSFDDQNMDVLTWIPDTLGVTFEFIPPSFVQDWILSTNPVHVDRMGPVVDSARIIRQERGRDLLEVVFSEIIDTLHLPDAPWLEFRLYGRQDEESYDLSDLGRWTDENRVFRVRLGEWGFHDTKIFPRDAVSFSAKDPVYDLYGNPSEVRNPEQIITGTFRIETDAPDLVSYDPLDLGEFKEGVEVHFFDPRDDPAQVADARGWAGIGIGPLKLNESDRMRPEDKRWRWELQIFSSTGQFVIRKTGTIWCDDPAFQGNESEDCKFGRGRSAFLRWNMISEEGRFVGSGVYLLRLILNNQSLPIRKIGIMRQ